MQIGLPMYIYIYIVFLFKHFFNKKNWEGTRFFLVEWRGEKRVFGGGNIFWGAGGIHCFLAVSVFK